MNNKLKKNKIRWGILSTASIARNSVIPAIQTSKNGEVVAIASRTLKKAQTFANELKIPKYYGSYEELLQDSDIDAIYNPLPVSMHAGWSIKCAEAGIPVLCEKPMAAKVSDVLQMINTFAQKDLLLAEAHMYRYHPMTKKVIQMIRGGEIGKLCTMHSLFNAFISDPNDIRRQKNTGGGALLDLGCYNVSIMRHMAGDEPVSVKALAQLNDDGVDISMGGVLQFPSGVIGHFGCSMESPFECSYGAAGTEGKILIDYGGMVAWPNEEFKIKHWRGDDYNEIIISAANHYQLMVEDFANELLTGQPMEFSLDDTVKNIRVIENLMKFWI